MKLHLLSSAVLLTAAATVYSSPTPAAPSTNTSDVDFLNDPDSFNAIELDPVVEDALRMREHKLRFVKRDAYKDLKAFDLKNAKQMCEPTFKTPDEALKVWWQTAAGKMMSPLLYRNRFTDPFVHTQATS